MWIPKKILQDGGRSAAVASVVRSDSNGVSVSGDISAESIKKLVPYGIDYVPPVGSKGVVVPVGEDEFFCGAAQSSGIRLEEGELALYSSGGASIVLKNDGTVLINGKVYDSEGD